MIGIVVRFDLKDSTAASAFDVLTQEVLVGIAENEPGTQVYATQSLLELFQPGPAKGLPSALIVRPEFNEGRREHGKT